MIGKGGNVYMIDIRVPGGKLHFNNRQRFMQWIFGAATHVPPSKIEQEAPRLKRSKGMGRYASSALEDHFVRRAEYAEHRRRQRQ